MNDAVFSKAIENLRYRIDVRLASNEKEYLKWTLKPSNMQPKLFDNYLVTLHKSKVTFTLNKPAKVRMCILDLSKVLMYELHYDYIKNKYGNNSRLSTDNGTLMYEIQHDI